MRRYHQVSPRPSEARPPFERPNSARWRPPLTLEMRQADFTKPLQLICLLEQFAEGAYHLSAHTAQRSIGANVPGKRFAVHARQRQCPGPASGADGKGLPRVERATRASAARFPTAPPIAVEASSHQGGTPHHPLGLPLEQRCERQDSLACARRLRFFAHPLWLRSSSSHISDISSQMALLFR